MSDVDMQLSHARVHGLQTQIKLMKKSIPDTMFAEHDQVRLSALQNWILDHGVTEIVMTERQFWKFVSVQPLAEKPWATYMGRPICVPDMPERSQKRLGLFERQPGQI